MALSTALETILIENQAYFVKKVRPSKQQAYTFNNQKIILSKREEDLLRELLHNYALFKETENQLTGNFDSPTRNKLLDKRCLDIIPKSLSISKATYWAYLNSLSQKLEATDIVALAEISMKIGSHNNS